MGLLSAMLAAAAATGVTATTSAAAHPAAGGVALDVTVGADFEYTVSVGGETWLHSSPVRAYFDHTEHASPSKQGASVGGKGNDEIVRSHQPRTGTIIESRFCYKYTNILLLL